LHGESPELERVERIVNAQILGTRISGLVSHHAGRGEKTGRQGVFDEKYGEEVRVVSNPGFSTELCGRRPRGRHGDILPLQDSARGGHRRGGRAHHRRGGNAALEHVLDTAHVVSELSLRLGGDP
jgi:alanyl-tRNA synthetase